MSNFDDLIKNINSLKGVGKKTAQRIAIDFISEKERALELLNELISQVNDVEFSEDNTPFELKTFNNAPLLLFSNLLDLLQYKELLPSGFNLYNLGISDKDSMIKGETIKALISFINQYNTTEVIFSMGEDNKTSILINIIKKNLSDRKIKFSKIATGIPFGGKVEYFDPNTLRAAFNGREDV